MKIRKIGLLILLVVLTFAATAFAEDSASKYTEAQDLMGQGKFTEAATIFDSISTYEDASKLALYCKACAMCDSGYYDIGISTLESLGDFKDCKLRVNYYSARLLDESTVGSTDLEAMEAAKFYYNQNPLFLDSFSRIVALDERIEGAKNTIYNDAIKAGDSGHYDKAISALGQITGYEDSNQRIIYYAIRKDEDALNKDDQDAVIAIANRYIDMGEYLDAPSCAALLNSTADQIVAEKYKAVSTSINAGTLAEADAVLNGFGHYGNEAVKEHYYLLAEAYRMAENWENAVAAFTKADGYNDAQTQILATYYAEGKDEQAAGNWSEAVAAFTKAGSYSDAQTQILATYYAEGETQKAAENWTGAVAAFTNADTYKDSAIRKKYCYARELEAKTLLNNSWMSPSALCEEILSTINAYEECGDFEDATERLNAVMSDAGATMVLAGNIQSLSEGILVFSFKYKMGLVDAESGRLISKPYWDQIDGIHDGLAVVHLDNKEGLIDKNGKVISEPQWDNIWNDGEGFPNSIVQVKKDEKWGFVDKSGKVISEPQWDEVCSFSEGLAAVKKDGKLGFIDTTGKVIIEPQWDCDENVVYEFSEGLANVEKDGKWGYIDTNGKVVIKPQWGDAGNFHEGLAAVQKNGKWGFINTNGKVVIKPQWSNAGGFSAGLAAIQKNDKWGFIDTTGKVVIKPKWYRVESFAGGLTKVWEETTSGFVFGLIDTTGTVVVEPQWDFIGSFSDGMAQVKRDKKYGLIDTTGKVVVEPQWRNVSSFVNGLAVVTDEDWEHGIINASGEVICGFGVTPTFPLQ